MAMLREREWTLDELARNFVVSKKVIINDLEHIARSVPRPTRLQTLCANNSETPTPF